ncbi:WD40 repeat-like protein, partial [Wolfiporia cocos MD-104 SS10]
VQIWQVSEKRLVKRLSGHTNVVRDVNVSSNGAWLVSGSEDATVKCWSMPNGSDLIWTATVESGVAAVSFFSHSQLVAVGLFSGKILILNASTGSQIHQLQGHQGCVQSLVFTHGGQTLVSSSDDCTLKFWDIGSIVTEHHVQESADDVLASDGHISSVSSVVISPDEQWIISGSMDGGVHFWDTKSGRLYCRLKGSNELGMSSCL